MENLNIEKIIDEVINGTSLREAGRKYQIDRESLKNRCMEYFKTNPTKLQAFEQAIRDNKANSTQVTIPDEILKQVCLDVCYKKDNIRAIATRMKVDEDTLKEKIFQFLSKPEHLVLARKYIEYQAMLHPDYSYINFKALIVEMMKNNQSQSQIAEEYGIPARTLGREIEKLKQEEGYERLYDICKEYSYRKMKRKPFTEFERLLMQTVIEEYGDEGPIIVEGGSDKKKMQYEKAKQNVEKAEQINGTEQEKAKALGISVSTLRRNKIFVAKYEKEQEISDDKQK